MYGTLGVGGRQRQKAEVEKRCIAEAAEAAEAEPKKREMLESKGEACSARG